MVYFFKVKGENYFKIGYSGSNVKGRFAAAKTANHKAIFIYKVIEGDRDLESRFHDYFKKYWSGGGTEWFNITKRQVDSAIKKLAASSKVNPEKKSRYMGFWLILLSILLIILILII